MNILLFPRVILKSGVGMYVKQLTEELCSQGNKVFLVYAKNELELSSPNGEGYLIDLETRNPIKFVKNIITLKTIIKQNHIEVVHCHHRIPALYMRIMNVFWHIPTVYTLHLAPVRHGFLHRMTTWGGHKTIAISEEVKIFLTKAFKIPQNKITKVLNGVDEKKLTPMSKEEKLITRKYFNIKECKKVIALHSRIVPVKGQLEVAKALVKCPANIRKKLIILCSGETKGDYYHRLEKFIQENHIEENFVFCGWKSAREVIGASDIMMLPSTHEGFGLNCIEAMFMKVPVVRTKLPGYLDMKDYCFSLESTESDSIKTVLVDIVNNYEKYQNIVEKAHLFASYNCSISAMTNKCFKVYETIIQSSNE